MNMMLHLNPAPRSNQAIIFRSIVVERESSLNAFFRPPTSLSQAVAVRVLAKHSSGEHWQYAKYSTQAVAVYTVTESR